MLIYLILFALLGTMLGVFTGLTPGIHVNNIALIALYLYASGFNPWYLSVLIVSAMISHTFLDFIPSTFLGAPGEDTALSVLPMHRMLLNGEGYKAVYLSAIGSLMAMLFSLPIIAVIQLFFENIAYASVKPWIPVVLIAIVLYLLYQESKKGLKNMAIAAYVFIIAGIFGILALSIPQNFNYVPINIGSGIIFAVFAGLFGLPTLFLSTNSVIPEQKVEKFEIERSYYKASLYGTLSGALVGFLPGISSGIATVIAKGIYRDEDTEGFIVSLGSVNTANALFNLAALFIIMHPRSHAVGVISEMSSAIPWVNFFSPPLFFISLLIAAFIASALAFFLTVYIGRYAAKLTYRFGTHYKRLCYGIIAFVFSLIFLFGGVLGVALAIDGTLIGLLPPKLGVMRVHLMGVLILPVLLFYVL